MSRRRKIDKNIVCPTFKGDGKPTFAPQSYSAIYIQTDSKPKFRQFFWTIDKGWRTWKQLMEA